jgi:hypothetical protein
LLALAAPAFADTDPGASACQPAQGQITEAVAQTGQLGTIISAIAPIKRTQPAAPVQLLIA